MSQQYYRTSREHVLAHLERIDLLIRAHVSHARVTQPNEDQFKGLYLSEADIDGLLDQPMGMPGWWSAREPALEARNQELMDRLCRTIAERTAESESRGLSLRLNELARSFELTAFDVDALLVALAPEVDVRYERLYAYLQDDVTKKKPSVDLVLNLLCPTVEAKLDLRARFASHAPLLKHRLINLFNDPSHPYSSWLGKFVHLDERIMNFLLDIDAHDQQMAGLSQYLIPKKALDDLYLPGEMKERLAGFVTYATTSGSSMVVYFQGSYGVGKQTAAEAVCHAIGYTMIIMDVKRLAQSDHAVFESVVQRASREAILRHAAVYWRDFDVLLAEDKRGWLESLLRQIEEATGPVFFSGTTPWEPADALHEIPFIRLELPLPVYADRVALWRQGLLPHSGGIDVTVLANAFRLSVGQIHDAIITARNLARYRDPESPVPTMADFFLACRLQSQRKLSTLARKIHPQYTWDQIVLPSDRLQQLREMCNQAKHRAVVYDQWGFDKKLSLGKGLTLLFAGPSGTGKTMAAEIIANELGLDLYKIDLSMVVSKYIGETEKNLGAIFAEAASSNAILFFDEADALFGKRSEVRDSHDRYANIEVGYLLQKMEEYEGIVILATNLGKNMDGAFMRRIHASVEFPFPTAQDRLRIWEKIWPHETPRSHDVDLPALATRFEITGGNIRNIALAATFLAAGQGRSVSMDHLLSATRREYQKMGKVTAEDEFSHTGPPSN